jgi:dipeptidyl aminopeptidase/acylaminoacyl peptidase
MPGAIAPPTPTTPGRHEVTLPGDGVSLGGYLHIPDSPGPSPALIVLHGWQPAGTNGAAVVDARARRYAEDGYVALALSLRGWPPSGGADDCALRQPGDVANALSWLRTLPGVLPDRIGLVGFSQGGQVALLTAARDSRLRGVVAYYPVADVASWKITTTNTDIPGYIGAICEPGGVNARSPLSHASTITAPVLLVHGDADTRVPTAQSEAMHATMRSAGRTSDLLLVRGAQHGFTAAEEAVARPVVDGFLASRLRE